MDVFDIAAGPGGDFLRAAAIDAGHELGLFAALARPGGPVTIAALARDLGVPARRPRLRALVDVLVALGAIGRRDGGLVAGAVPPRPVVARDGWGTMAAVIRDDRPLAIDGGDAATRRLHDHLATAGAAAARELAATLPRGSLLDLGGGAGAYTAAFLAADPANRATVVDAPGVLAIAGEALARFGARVALVDGDARTAAAGTGHAAALLSNVLHFHAPEACVALCAAAARAVAPGGVVVIKDLRVDDDRGGPVEGLLFALNMAIYTDDGDVHATAALRDYLAAAGLVDVEVRRLVAAPEAVVVIGRRPPATDAPATDAPATDPPAADAPATDPPAVGDDVGAELDAALARTARDAWRALADGAGLVDRHDQLDAGTAPPALALPRALRAALVDAIATERAEAARDPAAAARAEGLVRHYTDVMPRMRVAQLAGTAEPAATVFHARLDWPRLPRLATAIDRLFALLDDAGVAAEPALGAASAGAFRARTPTLAALFERTHYGGAMPLLYGYPADLAYFARRAAEDGLDLQAMIDRYLTAPMVHELCHFARGREAIRPPHLDECIGGWLGVHVHPEFAYPAEGRDDAIYAAPWLAQVGQAIARAFGIAAVVRAHAGAVAWETAVPPAFIAAAARLGRDDWRARRPLHLLADTMDPAPWVALAFAVAAGRGVDGETLASLAARPLTAIAPPDDPDFDRAIVADALRAMCLVNARVDGSVRTTTAVPGEPIAIDARACRVTVPRRGDVDVVAPAYWLPPAVAARIAASGLAGYELRLSAVAAIPAAAAAIAGAVPDPGGDPPAPPGGGFVLVARPAG